MKNEELNIKNLTQDGNTTKKATDEKSAAR